jgi:hypothetical protein
MNFVNQFLFRPYRYIHLQYNLIKTSRSGRLNVGFQLRKYSWRFWMVFRTGRSKFRSVGWFVVAHKPHSARHEGVWPTEVIASPILTIVIKWRWMGQLHDGAVLTLGLWIPIWASWHTTYFNILIEWCDRVWPMSLDLESLWPRMLKMLGHPVVEW